MPQSSNLTSVLARRFFVVVAIIGIATVAGVAFSGKNKQLQYSGSLGVSVRVNYPAKSDTSLTLTDQAADTTQAVATVQAWIADPAFVSAVLQQAGKDSAVIDVTEQATLFTVVGTPSATSFQVQASDAKKEVVETELKAVAAQLRTQADTYNDLAATAPQVVIGTTDAVITQDKQAVPLTPIAAFLAGCVIAFLVVAALERK